MAKTKTATKEPLEITTNKQPMSKKKKITIITSIICAVIIVLTTIISVVLITRKKWDLSPNYEINYNNHTKMRVVSPANNVTVYNTSNPTYYSNGTVIIENVDTDTYGVYSYIENKEIIPTSYQFAHIIPTNLVSNGEETGDTIFKVKNKFGEISNIISFFDDNGNNLNITEYNEEESQNYGYIKQRNISVSEKRKGVKVKIKDDFYNERIKISDATYVESYIRDGVYNYELWNLTSSDGIVYQNLYKVEDKERELVQTLNNLTGNNIELENANLQTVFLNNGTPAFYLSQVISSTNNESLLQISVYDENLNKVGSTEISNEDMISSFIIGNKLFMQFAIPCSDDNYDFSKTTQSSFSTSTYYYQLETYSISLKNGKFKEEKFDYLITDINTEFNPETALIYGQKVDDGILKDTELLLLNEKLQTKKISYDINSITKITKDRFLVENNQGQYLIDEDYELICYLGSHDSFFTTSNAVILANYSTGYSYVCSLDGTVVKKYKTDDITNAYDDKYYMIEEETTRADGTYSETYLETLGVRNETPIYSQKTESDTYTYNGQEYVAYNMDVFEDGISIITRVRENGDTFSYEFYNLDGTKLLQLDNFTTSDRVLTYWNYSDDDHALLYISTNVGGIGYTLVVNK